MFQLWFIVFTILPSIYQEVNSRNYLDSGDLLYGIQKERKHLLQYTYCYI